MLFFIYTFKYITTISATIDTIIIDQIVEYISSHNIIKDNFNSIKELLEEYDEDEDEGDNISSAIAEFFDGVDGEFNFDDDIVQPLYNMTEGHLSFTELREVLSDSEEVVNILRYVYIECNESDSVDIFGQHLRNNNMSKMTDLYMYFKAKEILNDYNDELLNKVVELYKEEELEQNLIKVSRNNAISKIKRNRIYNTGLGLKLAVKAFSKDF